MELYDLSMLMGDNTKADMFLAKRSLNLQPAGSEKQWHILLINTKSGEIPALCLYNDHTTGSSVVLRSGTIFKNNPYENIPVEMKDGSAPPAPSVNLFRASYVPSSGIAGDAGEISDASKERVKESLDLLLQKGKAVPPAEWEKKIGEMQEKQDSLKKQLKQVEEEKDAVMADFSGSEKARKRLEKEAEDLKSVIEKVKAARDKLRNDNAALKEENENLKKAAGDHAAGENASDDEIRSRVNSTFGKDGLSKKIENGAKRTSARVFAEGCSKQIAELKKQLDEKNMEIEELKKALTEGKGSDAAEQSSETIVLQKPEKEGKRLTLTVSEKTAEEWHEITAQLPYRQTAADAALNRFIEDIHSEKIEFKIKL